MDFDSDTFFCFRPCACYLLHASLIVLISRIFRSGKCKKNDDTFVVEKYLWKWNGP